MTPIDWIILDTQFNQCQRKAGEHDHDNDPDSMIKVGISKIMLAITIFLFILKMFGIGA